MRSTPANDRTYDQHLQPFALNSSGSTGKETHHLASLRALLDIHDELLLALLKLCPFPVQLTLRFREGALMLAQTLCWGDRSAKECFLYGIRGRMRQQG